MLEGSGTQSPHMGGGGGTNAASDPKTRIVDASRRADSNLWAMGAAEAAHNPRQTTKAASARTRSSTLAKCLFRRTWANLLSLSPRQSELLSEVRPLTGEPDAGKSASPVRREGRGSIPRCYPYRFYNCKKDRLKIRERAGEGFPFIFLFNFGSKARRKPGRAMMALMI